MIRDGGREVNERELWMEMDPIRRCQTSIKPFFDSIKTLSVIAPSEGITNKTKVNQT
jgi:hypothetical protein